MKPKKKKKDAINLKIAGLVLGIHPPSGAAAPASTAMTTEPPYMTAAIPTHSES
jgi:hypothetical protein